MLLLPYDDGQHKVHVIFYLFGGFSKMQRVYVLYPHYLHNISCCSKFSTHKQINFFVVWWKKKFYEREKAVEISYNHVGHMFKKYIVLIERLFSFFFSLHCSFNMAQNIKIHLAAHILQTYRWWYYNFR